MQQYLDALKHVLENGIVKEDRTGTGTISVFGGEERYNLYPNILPTVTTKRIHLPSIVHELLWFIKGDTNTKYLIDNGVRIWNEWFIEGSDRYKPMTVPEIKKAILRVAPRSRLADNTRDQLVTKYKKRFGKEPIKLSESDVGALYPKQWRNLTKMRVTYSSEEKLHLESLGYRRNRRMPIGAPYCLEKRVDQLSNVIDLLQNNPDSRRIIINAWNPLDLDEMVLSPCHAFVQFYTRELTIVERVDYANTMMRAKIKTKVLKLMEKAVNELNVPTRALSCKLYQRQYSAF